MKKSIMIELDKARNLRFGINILCQMEDMLGKPISQLEGSTGIKDLRIMLYCGLRWEDKELTLEKVGELMDDVITEKGMDYLSGKLSEAINLAIPDDKNKKKVIHPALK